ncbi:Flagellar basal-body rod protein FlgB [Labilithrix luteola]|uniref:Flagellar basal body rod protein FlgB n=1 Tax=Labilithrix luteola TaxID=1391654 RepID=A0A0K1PMP2_9BACT|nr:flagellar basal body rod protein FlgB [Labilithrix luteola]AKU94676.1 Flagellar basal-body rod protein FlgB [Labilithrix luteola]
MSLLDSVERLRTGLDYHLARHNVLVSNLAQADTPEYRPLDLARTEFQGAMNVALTATNSGHIGAPAGSSTAHFDVIKDPTAKAGADGNAVDIDREAVKISTNQMRYDMVAQLASSELATLEWAAADGRGG